MDGFKDTFAELYEVSRNSSSLQQNETRGCGSGSGTTSDSLIVKTLWLTSRYRDSIFSAYSLQAMH